MKRLTAVLLAAAMLLVLSSCGNTETTEEEITELPTIDMSLEPIKVGISAGNEEAPELFGYLDSRLAAKGYRLEYVEFDTTAQAEDELKNEAVDLVCMPDVRDFEKFNKENKDVLLNLGAVFFYPLGIYPAAAASVKNIEESATFYIPDDKEMTARALLLLEKAGVITLKEGADLTCGLKDIKDNPHTVQIEAIPLDDLPTHYTAKDVDFVVAPTLEMKNAGFIASKTAETVERFDSIAAKERGVIIMMKADRISDPKIAAIKPMLFSNLIYDMIDDVFYGTIIPSFSNRGTKS